MKLPYLTGDLPGIAGRIRERVEDFRVDEQPLYEASGSGTHVYFRVIKAGIPTPVAIGRIAKYMGVRPSEVGVAGLKDSRALTSQQMSLEHADSEKLARYHDSQMKVVWTGLHTNKLRPGHLAANRFTLRIRGVGSEQLSDAQDIIDVLCRRGVPNYFGVQRFGARNDTAVLGEALVRGDLEEFVAVLLGRAQPDDPPDCKAARDAFDSGFMNRALQCWPRHYSNERRALSAYKKKKRPQHALRATDKRMKRLYVSAFQSRLFNEVLIRRIDSIDRLLVGDLARKCDSGGVFTVEDIAVEQGRADAFEISPTGPIIGYRSSLAVGEAGVIEQSVLSESGITPEDFRNLGSLKAKGARRPLRFRIESPELTAGCDEHGSFIELAFSAQSGCYATVALREIMKDET